AFPDQCSAPGSRAEQRHHALPHPTAPGGSVSPPPAVTRSVVTRASRLFDLDTALLADLRAFLRETEEIPGDAQIRISDMPQVVGPLYRITITHTEDAR